MVFVFKLGSQQSCYSNELLILTFPMLIRWLLDSSPNDRRSYGFPSIAAPHHGVSVATILTRVGNHKQSYTLVRAAATHHSRQERVQSAWVIAGTQRPSVASANKTFRERKTVGKLNPFTTRSEGLKTVK